MTLQDATNCPYCHHSEPAEEPRCEPDCPALPPMVTSCDQEKVRGLVGLSNKQEEDPYTDSVFSFLVVADEHVVFDPL